TDKFVMFSKNSQLALREYYPSLRDRMVINTQSEATNQYITPNLTPLGMTMHSSFISLAEKQDCRTVLFLFLLRDFREVGVGHSEMLLLFSLPLGLSPPFFWSPLDIEVQFSAARPPDETPLTPEGQH
ncbi:hypothetical protein XENORESO_003556, partial [Xenotaenia resolanae]